jgi:DNA-directed RNA polymerase specialized sigma subunit
MPAHLLAVLVAYYLDGLTEPETAARLNLTRHQVRTRHDQAIELLRQLC